MQVGSKTCSWDDVHLHPCFNVGVFKFLYIDLATKVALYGVYRFLCIGFSYIGVRTVS